MLTARNFTRRAYQCSLYEAQDVLTSIDDVDLIEVRPKPGFPSRERLLRRLVFHDATRTMVFRNPGLHDVVLRQDYELFVAVCQNHWDFLYINAIRGWKDRCRTSVCWLDEVWLSDLHSIRHWLPALARFDHVFIGCAGSVPAVSEIVGRACGWLPGAVDMLRFTPYPDPPERVVDVYSIGRRWPGIHEALVRASAGKGLFYLHDTLASMAMMEATSPVQHRNLFASVAKRSRYFMVAPAKMDLPEETLGQVELGYRYFEGAAAGAVMIGQAADCPAFARVFPWPDVVVPIRPDGSDVLDVVAALDADPERRARIGRRNAAQALTRHDWVHRWHEILAAAGLEPSPRMTARARQLRELAALAAGSDVADDPAPCMSRSGLAAAALTPHAAGGGK
jgi:spore maturation protein CgeB